MRALVFYLLSHFLFVTRDNGAGFAALITVAEQLEVGRTPTPLCIWEMISTQDYVKKTRKGQISGSPLLL